MKKRLQPVRMWVVAVITALLLTLFLPPLGSVVAQSSPVARQSPPQVAGRSLANTGLTLVPIVLAGLFLVRMGIIIRRLGEDE